MSVKKHLARAATIVAVGASMCGLAACSTAMNGVNLTVPTITAGPATKVPVKVGFVAVGGGDAWTQANENDIRNSFTKKANFDLKFAPGKSRDQKSQIDAFNAFVDEGVDAILLSATVATGWEDSLQRAKTADIPVILIDRAIDPDTTSLYVTRIAPSNADTGKAVANWALSAFPEGAKYFALEGPSADAAVNERNQGWDGVMTAHPEFVKIGRVAAGSSADEAKSVTATMLAENANDVALIFTQSDEMALGAVQAVEEAGLVPGTNVKIVTTGGSKEVMQALFDGKVSFVAEYNPFLGQTAAAVVKTLVGGATVDSLISVPSVGYSSITQEQLDARQY